MQMGKEKTGKPKSVIGNVRLGLSAMFRSYPHTRWQLPLYMVCKVVMPFMVSLIPAIMIQAITMGSVKKFIGIMVGLLLVNGLIGLGHRMLDLEVANRRVYTRLEHFFCGFLDKNLDTDYANVEPQIQQKLIQKGLLSLNSNWVGIEQLMRTSVEFVIHMVGLVTYAYVITVLDFRIIIVLILTIVSNVLFHNYAMNYAHKHREQNTEVYRKRNYLKENSLKIQAGKDVRIYQMEHWFHAIFENLIEEAKDYQTKTEIRWYLPSVSDQIWIAIRDILTYSVLIGMVLTGEMEVATFTLLLGMVAGFSNWATSASEYYTALKKASLEVDDMQNVINMEDTFVREDGISVKGMNGAMKIEFRDVSFRYPGAEEDTLSHVSFVINPGEKIALVGSNGAGKTTIVKLLCGLYMPTQGKIFVNDMDLSTINILEYYELVSVLFQDINPMAFSIGVNVAGCIEEQIDQERLQRSLQRAGLWEKVQRLEHGTKTHITQTLDENGIQLSGGETQKLLLARAIYKDGPILVLDEPTSALDPIAESAIYEEYNEMTKEKSAIFISHRLASTKFCDRILFLEHGGIVEQGSHEELMKKSGKYREVYDIQSHYYQEGQVQINEI